MRTALLPAFHHSGHSFCFTTNRNSTADPCSVWGTQTREDEDFRKSWNSRRWMITGSGKLQAVQCCTASTYTKQPTRLHACLLQSCCCWFNLDCNNQDLVLVKSLDFPRGIIVKTVILWLCTIYSSQHGKFCYCQRYEHVNFIGFSKLLNANI